MGLSPSVYGGGGSSSEDFPKFSGFGSREREALVSATMEGEGPGSKDSSTGGGGAKAGAGRESDPDWLVAGLWDRLRSVGEAKTSEENGGGRDVNELEDEASETGDCGGGAV
ncbi:hypothetical protein AWENTII_003967 [Aspergillus wentii]